MLEPRTTPFPFPGVAIAIPVALILALSGCAATTPDAGKTTAQSPATVTDSLALATEQFARGTWLLERGKVDSAMVLLVEVEGVRARHLPPDDPALARVRGRIGGMLGEQGQFDDARAMIRGALGSVDRDPSPDSLVLAEVLNAQGRLMYHMRNYDESRRVLERALAIRDRIDSPTSLGTRIVVNNLATALANQGNLAGARPYFERLVTMAEQTVPPDSVRLGIATFNLANVVSDLGEHDAGLALYQRALLIRERIYGPTNPRVAMTLQSMASLAEIMHDPKEEEACVRRARDIYRAALGDGHPMTAEITVNHGDVLWRLGRQDEAFDLAMLGERLTREHLRRTAQGLPEADALQYEATRLEGLSVALTVAELTPKDPRLNETILDEAIRSRAVLLDEMAARRRLLAREADPSLKEVKEAWVEATTHYSELALRSVSSADAKSRAALEEARRAADEAETALAVESREARRRTSDRQLGLADVRLALPDSTVLVRYVKYDWRDRQTPATRQPRYAALVLTGRDAPVQLVPLGAATTMDSLVSVWRGHLTRPDSTLTARVRERRYREASRTLRERVWDSLATFVQGQRRVFIVSDGSLQLLALGSLPTRNGRYLVESVPPLQDLSAERDLVREREPREGSPSLLALGGVDFDRVDEGEMVASSVPPAESFRGALPDCEDLTARRFGPLPNTSIEVDDVAQAWRASQHDAAARATLLKGPAASEAAFKREASKARVIHIATHGFFVGPDCIGEFEEAANPLMLSGLVLSGANRHSDSTGSGEDGILTAEEVAAMDLSKAECVVLSACDTGVGSLVTGEGVFGLRRAFRIAGASNIVMSMWKVPDAATRWWMRAFYDARFRRGLGTAESVREASLSVLNRQRDRREATLPTSWGAFIASGDGR